MIEDRDSITLSAEETANPQAVETALRRAMGLGLKFCTPPGWTGDLALSPEAGRDHALYMHALRESSARGGAVRIVAVAASSSGDVHLSRADAAIHQRYMQALEQARRNNGVVVVDL